jgi:hypothetical protein
MSQRKINRFVPVGLLVLMAGIFLQHFTHERYSDFAGGFLMGRGSRVSDLRVVAEGEGRRPMMLLR